MRKVSRNVKVQLEQAVDSALQRGNHHGWALVMMVFFAVARKGWSRSFPAGGISTRCRDLAAAGCNARSCYCRGARLLALLGRYSPQSWCIFKWTSLFILFVAAGLAAGAIRAFHEAGLWNHFQEIAFDMSAVLSTHSLFGTLMEGFWLSGSAERQRSRRLVYLSHPGAGGICSATTRRGDSVSLRVTNTTQTLA